MATSSLNADLVLARQLAEVRSLMPSRSQLMRLGLISSGENAPIVNISQDENVKAVPSQKGATATMPFMNNLKTQGKLNGATLEGNEEKLTTSGSTVTLYQYDNAVKLEGRMEEQKAAFQLSAKYQKALGPWFANTHDWEWFRRCRPSALTSAVLTANGQVAVFPEGVDAVEDISADNRFSVSLLRKLQATISIKGFKPVTYMGGRSASGILLITPEQWHDLQTYDEDWKNGQYHAAARGESNGFFKMSEAQYVGTYSGIDIWCPTWDNDYVGDPDAPTNIAVQGGSMLKQDRTGEFVVSSAMLLCAGSSGLWMPGEPWTSKSSSDNYGNSPGWGMGFFMGAATAVIDRRTAGDAESKQNLGLAHVVTAATKIS